MNNDKTFDELKQLLFDNLVEIEGNEGLLFEKLEQQGWYIDGEFWCYPDELTYTLYFSKDATEYGPFTGSRKYSSDIIEWCVNALKPDFIIL